MPPHFRSFFLMLMHACISITYWSISNNLCCKPTGAWWQNQYKFLKGQTSGFFLELMAACYLKKMFFYFKFWFQRSQTHEMKVRLKSNYHIPLHHIHFFLHVALILFRILQKAYCSIFTMTSSSILFRGTPRGFVPEMQQPQRCELKTCFSRK